MSQHECLPPGERFLSLAEEPAGWVRRDPGHNITYVSLNELVAQNNLRIAEAAQLNNNGIRTSGTTEADAKHVYYVAQHVRAVNLTVLSDEIDPDIQANALNSFIRRRAEQGLRNRDVFCAGHDIGIDDFLQDEALQVEAVGWHKALEMHVVLPQLALTDPFLASIANSFPVLGSRIEAVRNGTARSEEDDMVSVYSQDSDRVGRRALSGSSFDRMARGFKDLGSSALEGVHIDRPSHPFSGNARAVTGVPPITQYASFSDRDPMRLYAEGSGSGRYQSSSGDGSALGLKNQGTKFPQSARSGLTDDNMYSRVGTNGLNAMGFGQSRRSTHSSGSNAMRSSQSRRSSHDSVYASEFKPAQAPARYVPRPLPGPGRPVITKEKSPAARKFKLVTLSPEQMAESAVSGNSPIKALSQPKEEKMPNHVRLARSRSVERSSPTKTGTGVDPLCAGRPASELRSAMGPSKNGLGKSKSVSIKDPRYENVFPRSQTTSALDQRQNSWVSRDQTTSSLDQGQYNVFPRSQTTSALDAKRLPDLPAPSPDFPVRRLIKKQPENKPKSLDQENMPQPLGQMAPSVEIPPNISGAGKNSKGGKESPLRAKWLSMKPMITGHLASTKNSGNIIKSAQHKKSKSEAIANASEEKGTGDKHHKKPQTDIKVIGTGSEKKPFLKGIWDSVTNKTRPKLGAGKEPYTIHHSHVPVDGLTPSGFMISCRPEYQCKMYARLNLLLSSLANRFLMEEFRAKRITETMAASFVEKWVELGRAQFTEFWCGLPFQARILFDCRDHCMFFGEYDRTRRDNILGYLKINANSMALATYCHGDSAIQKHFVDCWKVLDLLGATFAEYESMSRLHVGFHDTVKAEKKKNDKNGVEHYWDPAPVPVTPIIPRARTPML